MNKLRDIGLISIILMSVSILGTGVVNAQTGIDNVGVCVIGVPSPCNSPEYWGITNPYFWVKGYIEYSDIEGGCSFLEGDSGKDYELMYNKPLPPVGTHVKAYGRVRTDIATTCMIGEVLEVKYMIKIP